MRILLDECMPSPFSRLLADFEVHAVQSMGWAGEKNGVLLKLLKENNFDVLITVDQNLRRQQENDLIGMAVIVISAVSNRLDNLIPFAPAVIAALANIQPGEVIEIGD